MINHDQLPTTSHAPKKNWRTSVGPHFCMALPSCRHALAMWLCLKMEHRLQMSRGCIQFMSMPIPGFPKKIRHVFPQAPARWHWEVVPKMASTAPLAPLARQSFWLICIAAPDKFFHQLRWGSRGITSENYCERWWKCLSFMVNSEFWIPSLSQLPFFLRILALCW